MPTVTEQSDNAGVFTNANRAVRALRLRSGWAQAVLGNRAGVSRETVSRLERGDYSGMTLATLDGIAAALGATLQVNVRWRGEELDRLLDAAHAALQQSTAATLSRLGWLVRVEVSFNYYGDRGRVDILAFHPAARTALVIEIKSALGDLQETLGRLDVKVRIGRQLAQDANWSDAIAVVPCLVVGDTRLARRTVGAHDALFARYELRGRSAWRWLRRPVEPLPSGLLWFAEAASSHGATITRYTRAPKRTDSRHS